MRAAHKKSKYNKKNRKEEQKKTNYKWDTPYVMPAHFRCAEG